MQRIEKITGYEFKDSSLLQEALVSSTFRTYYSTRTFKLLYPQTHITATHGSANYERLEFLGDAVLDMCKCKVLPCGYTKLSLS
jgi:dsRNA-specific ribonuclease